MEHLALVFGWLAQPISGASEHHMTAWASWHGRGMVLAWAMFIPAGVLVARYWKVTPAQEWPAELDNKFWWHSHRALQYGGALLTLIALIPAWMYASKATAGAQVHGLLGWFVVTMGAAQVGSGLLRGTKGGPTGEGASRGDWRGDHYDMSPHRVVFEYAHKYGGLLALLTSAAAIVAGLLLADAPRWMFLVIFAWWVVLFLFAIWWQHQGRCLDTYQAIWGPDIAHPGNRRDPIGIGVRQVRDLRNAHAPDDRMRRAGRVPSTPRGPS